MRAIAAFSILCYHVWLYGAPGGVTADVGPAKQIFENLRAGVTLFFVLSGFLLFRPYVASALRAGPTPSLRRYLRNRALRILPAYWVILLAVALVFEHQLLHAPQQLLANAFLAQGYVSSYSFGAGIVPAWSLAIEAVFYLCVPLLGLLAIHLARRGRINPVLAAFAPVALMIVVGFGAKGLTRAYSLGTVWQFCFLTHADWFAGGMALAVLRTLWEDGRFHLRRGWQLPALAVALILGAAGVKLYNGGQLSYVENQTPIMVSCTILLALVVFAEPGSKLVAVLTWRPIAAAGLVSYSVFLWHDPLVRYMQAHGLTAGGTLGFVFNVAMIAAITAALSTATYLFVEKPALSRKRSWQTGNEPADPGTGSALKQGAAAAPDRSDLRPAPAAGS